MKLCMREKDREEKRIFKYIFIYCTGVGLLFPLLWEKEAEPAPPQNILKSLIDF